MLCALNSRRVRCVVCCELCVVVYVMCLMFRFFYVLCVACWFVVCVLLFAYRVLSIVVYGL